MATCGCVTFSTKIQIAVLAFFTVNVKLSRTTVLHWVNQYYIRMKGNQHNLLHKCISIIVNIKKQ